MGNITGIHRIEQPREKMAKYGPEKLDDAELLAILLRTGTKEMSVLKLAQKILRVYKDRGVHDVHIDELQKIHGLGLAKSCEIVACFELGRRLLQGKKTQLIASPQDVWDRLKDIRSAKKEYFVVLYLDTRNQEIMHEVISVGTLNASLVHPREVFEPAVIHHCAQIIIAHNHPSGDPEESYDDIMTTRRLVEAGKILGIAVADHVIVTEKNFVSFKEKCLL